MTGPTERDRMRKLLLVGCAALVLGGSAAAVSSQTPRNETFRNVNIVSPMGPVTNGRVTRGDWMAPGQ